VCVKPSVLQGFGGFRFGWIILRFEIGFFGYRAQPSGLRPYPRSSDFEFSHSLVNTTLWLTARRDRVRRLRDHCAPESVSWVCQNINRAGSTHLAARRLGISYCEGRHPRVVGFALKMPVKLSRY
jgi:hypothetical protein